MREKDFAGDVLQRLDGYTAVCPTYPEGYSPDAVTVAAIDNSLGELQTESANTRPGCR